MSTFTIDFFELAFLAEACIPPVPIARGAFWDSLINIHYNNMTKDERLRMFEWMQRSSDRFSLEKEGCRTFYARYNPDNQFKVTCFYKGMPQVVECWLMDDKYHTGINQSINPEYIKSIEKL